MQEYFTPEPFLCAKEMFKKRAILSFLSAVQKNSVASEIQTLIFGREGKDADHLTTTVTTAT